MQFLCEMWKFSAEEYMTFLNRNGIKCFSIQIIYRNRVLIYADEERYLHLSINDRKFDEDEKQILKLLERSEALVDKFIELAAKIEANHEHSEEMPQQNEDEN